ncbi:glyoxalase [Caldimonas brevitalea]|uniref:Glyoxalase n=2 Tax=Caldimonas brevitalea TaxID=413882 RepID=A0A0G3BUY1_9BURK|nr:glyoxalase [Caldimonas brevitalea]
MLSHVSIGTNQFGRAVQFYEHVLATLGCRKLMEFPEAVAFGRLYPEFWVQQPIDGHPAATANGVHFGFVADSREQVRAFHEAALAQGGRDDGGPGPRPDYGAAYYGCFIRDLDGHKIEATFWDESLDGAGHGAAHDHAHGAG